MPRPRSPGKVPAQRSAAASSTMKTASPYPKWVQLRCASRSAVMHRQYEILHGVVFVAARAGTSGACDASLERQEMGLSCTDERYAWHA